MKIVSDMNVRPTLSLPFGGKVLPRSNPLPTGILSSNQLKRIVADLLG